MQFLKILRHSRSFAEAIEFARNGKDVCLISNNCLATFFYKDLGLPYGSPTINLQLHPRDFIKFCRYFDDYIRLPIENNPKDCIEEFKSLGFHGNSINFPVGRLGSLNVFLQHYESIDDARAAWLRRVLRINREKLFFVFVADDFIDASLLNEFRNLEVKNKLLITNSDKRGIFPFSFPIFNGRKAWFSRKKPFGKRFFWRYDFIGWINKSIH